MNKICAIFLFNGCDQPGQTNTILCNIHKESEVKRNDTERTTGQRD